MKFDPLVDGGKNTARKSPNFHRGRRNPNPSKLDITVCLVSLPVCRFSSDLMAMDTPPHVTPVHAKELDLLTSSPSKLQTPQVSYMKQCRMLPDKPKISSLIHDHVQMCNHLYGHSFMSLPQTSSMYEAADFPSQPTHPPLSSLSTSSQQAPYTPPTSSPSSSRRSPSAPSPSVRGRREGTLVEVLKYGEEDMAAMVEQTRHEERVKVSCGDTHGRRWFPHIYPHSSMRLRCSC